MSHPTGAALSAAVTAQQDHVNALLREACDLPNPERSLLTHNERELIGFCLRLAAALAESAKQPWSFR